MSTKNEVSGTEHSPGEGSADDHANAEPLTNWATISQFVVQVNKHTKVVAPIYANGRQQAPIEIVIQARDANGIAVNLTAAQLKSIRLIEYDTGAAVGNVFDTKKDLYVYQWSVTREDGTEVEDAASAENDVPEVAAQSVIKYVHKTQVATNWIAAEITSPSGVVFRTNTPNPTAGKFDSWVKLEGREPKVTPWQEFSISAPKTVESTTDWVVTMYYIYFTNSNNRIVGSINYQELTRGVHFTLDQYNDKRVEQIAFVVGPQFNYVHWSCIDGRKTTFIINDRAGQASVARIFDSTKYYCGYERLRNGLMGYIDQFGNESKITVKAVSDGSTYGAGGAIRLDDPANVHEEFPMRP